jgi:hypothetical protein
LAGGASAVPAAGAPAADSALTGSVEQKDTSGTAAYAVAPAAVAADRSIVV